MNISYLKEFIVLAEKGNFQKAAEDLYLSQPSLTRHIMMLEKDLGTKVFSRTTRKTELNEFGRLLLPYAKEIVRLYEEYTNSISKMFKDASSLIIGSIPAMKQYNIINLLALFKQEYPNCAVKVIEESTYVLIKLLKEGKCDFAFLRGFRNSHDNLDSEIQRVLIDNDSMVAVLPPEHPLANLKVVTIDQIKNESLLLLKGGILYDRLLTTFDTAGAHPNVSFIGMRVESVIDMASKGMGIAFVLKSSALSQDNHDVAVAEIEPVSDFVIDINLAYMKSNKMSPASICFLDVVKRWNEGSN